MEAQRGTIPNITQIDVRAARGRFLIHTRSNAVYTIDCFAMNNGTVLVAGGSNNVKNMERCVEGGIIRQGASILFVKGGNTTSVQGIYDITHMPAHQIALLGRDVL